MFIDKILIIIIGISQGAAVGTAFAAFITILDIIYRLLQISLTPKYLRLYEKSIIISFSLFAFLNLIDFNVNLGIITTIYFGLFTGIFIGLFASALAEVLNVIPVIVNKLNCHQYIDYIILSMIAGKVIGSMVYWLKVN